MGGNGSSVVPSTVGEVRPTNRSWTALAVPATQSGSFSSASCWSDGCLIGGSQLTGDLLWAYNATDHSVVPTAHPSGGQAVGAVSCFADSACAVIDTTGARGGSRLSFTNDGGAVWSGSAPMAWAGVAVSALSCSDALDCLAATSTPSSQVLVEVTHDGGVTWSARHVPPQWTTLSSLTCTQLRCNALATTATGSLLVRTHTFGRVWSKIALAHHAGALACAALTTCVVAGEIDSHTPWLASLHGASIVSVALKYVPSPLTDVACGPKVCAAVGASTVVALRP